MSRPILSLSLEQLTAFDLDALVAHAELLNQQNRETFTTPFPKRQAAGSSLLMSPLFSRQIFNAHRMPPTASK